MGKRKCFQQIVLVKLDIHTQKKGSVVYVDLYLTLSIKINSNCIKGLKVKDKSIKFLEENMRKSCLTLDLAIIS